MTDEPADAGRDRYFALQRLARSQGRGTQELLTLYALEGLLARLAAAGQVDRFVLKSGMLLAAFGQRRPTRDLDVHADTPPADLDTVRDAIAEVAAVSLDDGLRFDTDVYLLTRQHPVAGSDLVEAIRQVAAHRAVQLARLAETLGGYAELAQSKWAAWRDRHELSDRLPVAFADVLDEVVAFADPAIAGDITDATWNPDAGAWSS